MTVITTHVYLDKIQLIKHRLPLPSSWRRENLDIPNFEVSLICDYFRIYSDYQHQVVRESLRTTFQINGFPKIKESKRRGETTKGGREVQILHKRTGVNSESCRTRQKQLITHINWDSRDNMVGVVKQKYSVNKRLDSVLTECFCRVIVGFPFLKLYYFTHFQGFSSSSSPVSSDSTTLQSLYSL